MQATFIGIKTRKPFDTCKSIQNHFELPEVYVENSILYIPVDGPMGFSLNELRDVVQAVAPAQIGIGDVDEDGGVLIELHFTGSNVKYMYFENGRLIREGAGCFV